MPGPACQLMQAKKSAAIAQRTREQLAIWEQVRV